MTAEQIRYGQSFERRALALLRLNVWRYDGILVETSTELSHELWEKLSAYVKLIRPPAIEDFQI